LSFLLFHFFFYPPGLQLPFPVMSPLYGLLTSAQGAPRATEMRTPETAGRDLSEEESVRLLSDVPEFSSRIRFSLKPLFM